MRLFTRFVMAIFLIAVFVLPASPAAASDYMYSRQGKFDLGAGAGMTVRSPVHFALELFGEYYFTNNIAFGATLDTLIRDPHVFIIRPFARYHIDISRYPKWVPYVGGGVGGAFNTDGDGALDVMLPNFGFKYAIADRMHIGSDMGLHILTDFDDTRVDFQILFVTFSYRF